MRHFTRGGQRRSLPGNLRTGEKLAGDRPSAVAPVRGNLDAAASSVGGQALLGASDVAPQCCTPGEVVPIAPAASPDHAIRSDQVTAVEAKADAAMKPAAMAPGRGWHGMTARNSKRYSTDDWKIWGQLGGDVTLVDVAIGSPAWRAEIRDGTWILLMNSMTFEAFEAIGAQIGSTVSVKAFQPGFGHLHPTLTLVERPKAKRAPRRQNRAKVPIAACGKVITRDDRPKWLGELDERGWLSLSARVVGSLLCNRAINNDGWTDRWTCKRIAQQLGLSKDTVQRATKELKRAGLCDIRSGKHARRENRYTLTWPQDDQGKILPFILNGSGENTKR